MRILCTGGAGYIGSVLVPALLRQRHHVTVIDTFRDGGTSLAACCHDRLFEPVRADCRDMSVVSRHLSRADVIVPLAALVGAPLCSADQIGAVSTNQTAVEALVRSASRDQLVVFPTTNSGYGRGPADGSPCTELTPLLPLSLYGSTKVGAERAVIEGDGVSLRLATVFGMSPRMRLDLLVNDFVWRAVTDRAVVLFEAHFRRNYLHVGDAASALEHAIGGGLMRGHAYNVGLSSANLTKAQLCQKIREQIPAFEFFEAPVGEDPDKRDYIVSNEKIERTGWRAERSLEDGIAELVRGYQMLRNSRYSNI